jgi:autotransporter-associated beta strand protein
MTVFSLTFGKTRLWLAFLLSATAISLRAQTMDTWTGGGANNNWSTAGNWGGTVPVSGNALVFSGSTRPSNTNDIAGLNNLNTITFNTSAWNITGNAVTVTNAFTENASGSNTWGLPTAFGNTITINQGNAGSVLNFTGVLSGSGGLSTVAGVGGTGTIYLSNTNNSFTGNVNINSATAVFYNLANPGQNSSLGAGNGTVTFGSTATAYEGSLVFAGTANGSTTRPFEPEARTTGDPAFNNNSPNNSSLIFNGGWTARGDLNPFTVLLQGTSTGTNTFNAAITDASSPFAASFQISGPGAWVFGANNTYHGTTTINGGTLQLGAGGTSGNAGPSPTNAILFTGNGTLAVNRSDSPIFVNNMNLAGMDMFTILPGHGATFSGVLSGSGAFVNNSPGATITLAGFNTYSGATTAAAGTLSFSATASIASSSAINIGPGATLDVSLVSGGFSLAQGQLLDATGATGVINGNLNLASGGVILSYAPGLPALSVTGGTLKFSNNPVTIAVPGNGSLPLGVYELVAPGTGGSVAGSVANSALTSNAHDDFALSLSISNGGLYLIVTPSTATIPTATTLTSSPNPAVLGAVPVTLMVSVTPAPTNGEWITFTEGATNLGLTPLSNGVAVLTGAASSLGTHFITASYGGDGFYEPSTSTLLAQVVNQTPNCYPQGSAFPLFMYEIEPSYAALADYGWNIAQEYSLNTNTDVNNFLQELVANNFAGPALIPDTGTNHPYTGWTQGSVQNWVQSIAVNTNLAWWSLPEEMNPGYSSETAILSNYTAWTRLYDPARRPNYEYTENADKDTTMKGIISFADVVGVSCYCEEVAMPHAWVRYKLQQVGGGAAALAGVALGSNYLAGQKTLIGIVSVSQFTNNSPSEPTAAQTYHDFWSAIASGAQGIAVWSQFHALTDDPANLTNNLNELNLAASQITGPAQVGTAIISGVVNSNVTVRVTAGPSQTVSFIPPGETASFQYPSINVLSKTWNGTAYVIAVNSTSSNVTAVITNIPTAASTAGLPFESRSVPLTNGALSDTFNAWGVHVYIMTAITAPVAPILYSTTASSAGSVTLTFGGVNGQTYRVLDTTNLAQPLSQWQTLANGTFGVNLIQYTDNATAGSARFYRLAAP